MGIKDVIIWLVPFCVAGMTCGILGDELWKAIIGSFVVALCIIFAKATN